MAAAKIKKGDQVIVLSGKDKGRTGEVIKAMPKDGKVVTLELDPHHAKVARSNFERAGVSGKIDLRVGPALQSLAALAGENARTFDLIFIDADKPNNPNYLNWAMKLSRPGTVIVCDNVIRDGAVVKYASPVTVPSTTTATDRCFTSPPSWVEVVTFLEIS